VRASNLVEFVQVHVFKPVTSKPGNSEVYVVAECFKTLDNELLSVLKRHIGLGSIFCNIAIANCHVLSYNLTVFVIPDA